MSQNEMILLVAGVPAVICLLWGFLKKPGHSLMVIARGMFSILLLYGIQLTCIHFGWGQGVRVNAMTIAVSGVLGIPGIVLLYLVRLL